MKLLEELTVFPSEKPTIVVYNEDDVYSGAHAYRIRNCAGFENGETVYKDTVQYIQFVHKDDDGTITPGLQSEQLVLVLMDRTKKLNNRFPCPENEDMIKALEMFLEASKRRVENRINRGVMGDLKK